MLILIPPSEGKTAPPTGAALELQQLSHPGLNEVRRRVIADLQATSVLPEAAAMIGVGAKQQDLLLRNAAILEQPCAPARLVYTGVLYAAIGAAEWDAPTAARAQARVRIVSALFGLLGPADHIPAYRLSMTSTLHSSGPLAALWRPEVAAELDALAADRLVIDCRSSTYASVWRRRGNVVTVNAVRSSGGQRTTVSHMAKHWRGLVAACALNIPGLASVDGLAHDISRSHGNLITDIEVSRNSQGNYAVVLVIPA